MSSAIYPDLKDKSVFITGGGSGIGAALTEAFIAQGAKVSFVQRSDASQFCAQIAEKYARQPLYIPCDITDINALEQAMDEAVQKNGAIEILINNAASDNRHKFEDTSVDDFDAGIEVNLRPHFFTAKHVAKNMAANGGGSIINFSSIAHHLAGDQYPVYITAKAGIAGLTRALADTLGKDNIRVNSVLPGWVLTDRQLELWANEKDIQTHLEKQSIPERLQPEDMIGIVLFLASSSSRMLTRQSIAVDGGVVGLG